MEETLARANGYALGLYRVTFVLNGEPMARILAVFEQALRLTPFQDGEALDRIAR